MISYRTRRATLDDLAQLGHLWEVAHLPVTELEKQLTEFQVAEDDTGQLVAAIALHIVGSSGRVHSETFADFGLTDTVRPELWKRLRTVAQNHGLFRLWTEETAPWWKKDAGFIVPSEEVLQKLPEPFGSRGRNWLVLQLKAELADPDLLDKEIAMFKEAERAQREVIMGRAKVIRVIGTVIAALVFLFAAAVFFFLIKNRVLFHHFQR